MKPQIIISLEVLQISHGWEFQGTFIALAIRFAKFFKKKN